MEATLVAISATLSPRAPAIVHLALLLELEPADGFQLNSVAHTFRAIVSVSHTNQPGAAGVAGNSVATTEHQLLHFNGKLFFRAIETTFSSIANTPPSIATFPPSTVVSELAVDALSGD